jgi:type IV pilus assembly protein PilC
MTEIGLKSGNLPEIFMEVSRFYEWEDKSIRDVKSAFAYPALVSILLLGMAIAAVTLIIPAYAAIFESNGIILPLPTRVLIGLSDALINHYPAIITITAVVIILAGLYLKSPAGKIRLNCLQLNFPIIKKIYRLRLNYKLARTAHILLSSGTAFTAAMEISFNALSSPCLSARLDSLLNDMSKGAKPGECFRKIKYFDDTLTDMIETGDDAGRLPFMLQAAAGYFKNELERTVKNLNTFIEPIITVLLGACVMAVLLAVVLPSFSLMEAV